VLLLVAPKERKVRIEVGYGLEGALTDSLSSQIIRREVLPAFREDQYQQGIQTGVTTIIKAIAGEYTAESSKRFGKDDISSSIGGFLPLLFIGIVAIGELLRRTGRQRLVKSVVPASFAGLIGTIISSNVLIGIGAAALLFLLIYLTSRNKDDDDDGPGNSSARRRRDIAAGTSGGFGSGRSGGMSGGLSGGMGGGMSGGGGSFGGGGASGSW